MKHIVVLIACTAALAGCNKSPQVRETNASVQQVANAVQQSGLANEIFLRAGEWKVTGAMEDMNIPGLPIQAQVEMRKAMGQQDMTYQYCLTPEEAKHPGGKFFTGKARNNCRYDHFTMGSGEINAGMHCDNQGAGTMTMTIAGTYAPDSYETHVTMNMKGGPQGAMSMKMRSEAHRVGECTPADAAEAKDHSGTNG